MMKQIEKSEAAEIAAISTALSMMDSLKICRCCGFEPRNPSLAHRVRPFGVCIVLLPMCSAKLATYVLELNRLRGAFCYGIGF